MSNMLLGAFVGAIAACIIAGADIKNSHKWRLVPTLLYVITFVSVGAIIGWLAL